MKLVNLSEVINEIEKFKGYLDEDMIWRIKFAINRLPATDAESVKHGHWIKKEHVYSSDSGVYRYECSLCHCSDEHNEDREVPYCWQCGALMDEAEFALVIHGKWINHGSYFTCSVCDEEQFGIDSGRYYCQNCGAKMDLNEVNDEIN